MSPGKMNKNLPSPFQPYRMPARSAGEMAFLELSRPQAGQVIGVTSRGIFVRTAPGGILFLSFEEFRGPLTINLAEPFTPFQALQNGAPVETGQLRLLIPSARIQVMADLSAVWHIPPPDLNGWLPWPSRLANCAVLAGRVSAGKKDAGLGAWLPVLLDPLQEKASEAVDITVEHLWPAALRLRQALQSKNAAAAAEAVSAFLGCGRGLTPSGDDFALGLLLAINRWGMLTWDSAWRSTLDEKVIQAARLKTTSLSAGLLECAAAGQADERLVNAVDYLFTGRGEPARLAAALSGWGSSSGIDALAGMTLGVLAAQ
jgi:hypothetical protein